MKPWLSVFLKLLFAAVSIAVLLQFAPVSQIVAVLGSVSLPWLVAGVALQFAVRFSATFRVQVVARNQGLVLDRSELYRILLASQFYSVFLPGVLGGGATWIKYIQHGATRVAAAAVVVLNRAIRTGMTVALGFCAWLLDRLPWSPLLAALLLPVAGGLVLLVALPPRREGPAAVAASRNPVVRHLRNLAGRFLRLLALSRRDKAVIFLASCADVLTIAMASWCLATAVGIEIAFLSVVWIHAALMVVLLIPVTVAGIGLREASLVGFGAILGIEAPLAMAWSLSILLGTLLVAAAGGLLEAGWTSRRIGAVLEKGGRDDAGRRAGP